LPAHGPDVLHPIFEASLWVVDAAIVDTAAAIVDTVAVPIAVAVAVAVACSMVFA
jgi:hypothetical protein